MPASRLVLGGGMVVLTIGAYSLAYQLYCRRPHPLLHPAWVSAALIIAVLSVCGLSLDQYQPAEAVSLRVLGPATVALAVPIYQQRQQLRAAALPLLGGVVVGALLSMATVVGLAALARLEPTVLRALALKSVTTPIAVGLARLEGSDPDLVASFVVLAALLGAMVGPAVLTRCRITDPVARGIALGSTATGFGTAAALQESRTAGATAGLAMVAGALVTALIAPTYIPALLRLLGA
jgi:putative effector of murein hydrolase